MNIKKDDFLMIASHFSFRARNDEKWEKERWRVVSRIISSYLDVDELYQFQDNREKLFVKIKMKEIDAWKKK